ncbi:N-acetyl-alpha-D-glucosaminyl L-malate synthase BshA [Catenovulum sp. SM1970]|uniref:N-acetyl-alpha-D-glucosaminyl L-malate synthase BshA n=1 Tax=Marinifaba aquimaris TaxID=2741323 RepID=UPI001571BBB4|nr:N-acetyl-alpha-D-glucosaminyl L-malate synthase BshA [Marinifaba aquimaris]NTS77652.1 N-acetyl-alpha-D-glucosaminyl L-malate synthase BshA [Marinifaba aquimaris]
MKIGIVCHPSIGGSGLVATQLGIGLAKLGHEVHFITRTMPFKLNGYEQNIHFHSVAAIHYPLFDDSLYTFALTAKIVEVVEQHKLDLVHAHYSIPHSLCANLASQIASQSFPTVTTIHGTDVTVLGHDKPLYPLNRFSILSSSLVTTVSNYQKHYLLKHFDLKDLKKDIQVVHNFIDLDVFTPNNENIKTRRAMANDDEKIILHASNFRQVKNTSGVVKTFAKVAKQIKARLVLVGDGPEVAETKALAEKLGIADKVNFFGKVQHMEKVIANADCLFQPSYFESFGMVALEGMASGVPCVSSQVDGIPEVIKHGENGFMAHPDDHDELAGYLTEVCCDSQLHEQLSQTGLQMARAHFNWQDKIEEYQACYRSLL